MKVASCLETTCLDTAAKEFAGKSVNQLFATINFTIASVFIRQPPRPQLQNPRSRKV